MKIIIKKEVANKIKEKILDDMPNESKGACFAYHKDEEVFEIIDTYISKYKGTKFFANLIVNRKYKKFEKLFYKSKGHDYKHYNYIGDWHSHPSFECVPSIFDKKEIDDELNHSNAYFLIQIILKVKEGLLLGRCFLYNDVDCGKEIEMVIEQQ